MILPLIEWIPGAVAVEYVKSRLAGYSKQSAWELLLAAVRGGKLAFKYVDLSTEFSHRDDCYMETPFKQEDFSIERQDLIDWVEMMSSPTKHCSGSDMPLARKNNSATSCSNDKMLKTKERDTLMKLIIGMAIAGYKYDPKANRNEATKDICDDLAKLGISLDPDTVRKWLREAAQILPRDLSIET